MSSYPRLRDARTRAQRRAAATAAQLGGFGRLIGEHLTVWTDSARRAATRPSLPALIGDTLHDDLIAAVGVGNIDRHYKPTAQLFTRRGVAAGFAKVGWTAPTAELVRRETAALSDWHATPSRPERVHAPCILASGTYNGMNYVVTQPLPPDARGAADNDPLPAVARTIAGPLRTQRLRDSAYWRDLMHRRDLMTATAHRRHAAPLVRTIAVLDEIAGDLPWRFGRWHGDWVSWNVANHGRDIHVWDWEHSSDDVPWGFDLLHWAITVPHLRGGRDYASAVATAAAAAPSDLTVTADVLLLAYLAEMGLRSAMLTTAEEPTDELYPGLSDAMGQMADAVAGRRA